MAEESFAERTEQATPRKREEAKKKGRVAKSREIPSVMILMAGISVLFLLGTSVYQQLSTLMVRLLRHVGTLSLYPANLQTLSTELIHAILLILSPVLTAVLVASILSHTAQSGTVFSMEVLKPDWSRISFLAGFSRVFSKQSLFELPKSLFKILIIGGVAWLTIKKEWPRIILLTDQEPTRMFQTILSISWSLFLRTGLVMMLLAGLDYLFQRWTFERDLRMTKEEIKEEMKMTEGDPLIKSRIRSIQRQLARRRMMAEVPKADVIITNPTHLAVALYYQSKEMEAPKVVAKGAGWIAEKIVEIGRKHQVPLVENKPLAQILYKTVDLGRAIPSTLYQAVADILAYVYRIKNKRL
jgi:flagellar biosynthetic protein FlhB